MIGSTWGRGSALASLLAWAAATSSLLMFAPTSAQAADLQVSFTMTALNVSGYKPDDLVTLDGTVANTGTAPAYGVQAILWRSRDEIRDLATLRQAETGAVLGARLPITADHYVVISTSNQAFNPGQSERVTLRATMADLGFDSKGAAFAFGADVIAGADPAAVAYRSVGQLRTFVPVPGKQKVPVTSIVLLTATPTKLVDDLFLNDSLPAELTGRLSMLLDAATQPGMSWAIDPALLDEVQDMADGYQVRTGDATVAGTGQEAARSWLDRFGRLSKESGGRTLFANPDITGARAAGDGAIITRAERASAKVTGLDGGLPLVVLPAGNALTTPTYDLVADSAADTVAAYNTVAAGALQAGVGEQPDVLGLSAAVPGAAETPQNLRRQFALATAVVAGGRGEVRLLRTVSDLGQDASAMDTWLTRRGLGELREAGTSVKRVGLVPAKPARLGPQVFEQLSRLESDFTVYAEFAPASTLSSQSDAAVTRGASSAWVGNTSGLATYLGGVKRLVSLPLLGRSVTLNASPRFLMSSRANQFPVTVTNGLTEKIQVKVVVRTGNPQRLTVPDSELVMVEPGQSVTVNIRPEASANGLVIARAHVATASGHRVTPDTTITIEVTDLGVVAWIIVCVSGLVLVAATAWRIRQVRRRQAAAEPTEGEA